MSNNNPSTSRGYLICLSATVLWSTTGVLISYLSTTYSLPSLVLAFWRDFSVSLILVLVFVFIARPRFRLGRSHWNFIAGYGLILALFNSMWTFSVQYNGAAVATVLAFSSPAITAILSHWILKEQINRVKLLSIVLSLFGTLLVSGEENPATWSLNPAGIVFGLLTGFFFASYNIFGKKASEREIDSWTALLYSFSVAAIFLFLFNVIFDSLLGMNLAGQLFWLGSSLNGWSLLIFLGIGPTVVGFGLYTVSLRYLPATTSNLIASLEPALTSVWAYFLLGEQLTGIQLFGGLLVLTGVFLLRVGERYGNVQLAQSTQEPMP